LNSPELKDRLKAIAELKQYDPEIAVPLLTNKMRDPEFLVRSFVARGFGTQQNADSFAALLEMVNLDRDPNVRAEAANSLSLFGEVSASHLTLIFHHDDNWLVRRSILAALVDLNYPEELFDVCICGIDGEDPAVKESAIEGLGFLANTPKEEAALEQLLTLTQTDWWRTRVQVAHALARFHCSSAKEALLRLKQDADHRVVGAVLESFVE
jgi:HEAT repeat protein